MFDEWPGMAIPIQQLPAPQQDALTIEVVHDEARFALWADVFQDAFGLPPDAALKMREAHAWHCTHNGRRKYLLMHRDGEAVATGILHSTPGVAGIYGIGVRKSSQKQGLGALATLLTVREGTRLGAKLAVLQASQQGFPVYEKLGFETICSFRSWRIG
jgi:hypothetical protein